MRKIGYLMMMSVMIMACSSEDNNVKGHKIEEGVLKYLKLDASATEVVVGEEVSFTLLDDVGKEVEGTILLNGKEIAKKYAFGNVGKFKVKGVKQGFDISNEITITVLDKVVEKSSLLLIVNKTEVEVGERVTFEVFSGDASVKAGVKILDLKTKKEIEGFEFVAKEEGEFKFIATGEGYIDSEEIVVKVKEAKVIHETVLVINGKELDLAYCTVEYRLLDRGLNIETDEVIGAVFDLGNGVYGNQYSLIIETKTNKEAQKGHVFVELLVPNPTIKVNKNGEVIDYGKRVLPTKDTEVKLRAIFSSIQGFEVNDTPRKVHEYKVDVDKFEFVDEPDEFGEYFGNMKLSFKYRSESNFVMDFKYDDEVYMVAFE